MEAAKEAIRKQNSEYSELYELTPSEILDSSMSVYELESIRDQYLAKATSKVEMDEIKADFGTFINGKKYIGEIEAEIAKAQAKLESIIAENKRKMQESIQVMINDVLNPAAYPDLSFEDLLNIETLLGSFDYSNLDYGQARSLMEGIVAGYNTTFRDVIESASWNLSIAEEDGMSQEIYDSMVEDLNNTKAAEIKPYL